MVSVSVAKTLLILVAMVTEEVALRYWEAGKSTVLEATPHVPSRHHGNE
jgi:hypothetical protein